MVISLKKLFATIMILLAMISANASMQQPSTENVGFFIAGVTIWIAIDTIADINKSTAQKGNEHASH